MLVVCRFCSWYSLYCYKGHSLIVVMSSISRTFTLTSAEDIHVLLLLIVVGKIYITTLCRIVSYTCVSSSSSALHPMQSCSQFFTGWNVEFDPSLCISHASLNGYFVVTHYIWDDIDMYWMKDANKPSWLHVHTICCYYCCTF